MNTYKQRNYENQRVKLVAVKEQIEKKEKFVAKLRSFLFDKDCNLFEKTTNFKAEYSAL